MHDVDLFQRALGLEEPWEVVDVGFDAGNRRLDLRIDFAKYVDEAVEAQDLSRTERVGVDETSSRRG